MPVYNGADFFSQAILSIQAQQYSPLEIIVVDDGSTDETAKVLAELGSDLRYTYQSNRGPAAAKNSGLKLSRGEIIAFLDADDVWPADKLHNQIPYLLENPLVQVVSGRIQYVQLPGGDEINFDFKEPNNALTHICFGAALFRKEAFDLVGHFDESLTYNEDHDWFLRARENNLAIHIIEPITLQVHRHGGNMTHRKDTIRLNLLKVLKNSLDRRREQGDGIARSLDAWSDFDKTKAHRAPDAES